MTERTLDEVLQSTSDNLFPAELGEAPVYIASTDCDGDTPLHVLIWRGDTDGSLLLIGGHRGRSSDLRNLEPDFLVLDRHGKKASIDELKRCIIAFWCIRFRFNEFLPAKK